MRLLLTHSHPTFAITQRHMVLGKSIAKDRDGNSVWGRSVRWEPFKGQRGWPADLLSLLGLLLASVLSTSVLSEDT